MALSRASPEVSINMAITTSYNRRSEVHIFFHGIMEPIMSLESVEDLISDSLRCLKYYTRTTTLSCVLLQLSPWTLIRPSSSVPKFRHLGGTNLGTAERTSSLTKYSTRCASNCARKHCLASMSKGTRLMSPSRNSCNCVRHLTNSVW